MAVGFILELASVAPTRSCAAFRVRVAMTYHTTPTCLLVLAIAFPATLCSTEPSNASKFPAVIRIVEAKPGSLTSFHVRLIADEGVDIYASQPRNVAWNHVAARLVIHDADGKPVAARFSYPDGIRIESDALGVLYVYRDSVDLTVAIADGKVKHPLSVTFEGAGYNRLGAFCLGRMKLKAARK